MLPPTLKPRTGIMTGLIPGLTLDLVAGIIQISLNRLNDVILEMELQQQSEGDQEGINSDFSEKAFEEHVKEMTTAEIQREIDTLKARSAR